MLKPGAAARPTSQFLTKESLARSLQQLVAINSVNPAYGGPDGGERGIIEWISSFLIELGLSPSRWDALPGRPNLAVSIPGETENTLAFITHVDTVSISGMSIEPLGGAIRDGRIWGRGTTDAKGQVVAMVHAFAEAALSKSKPRANILLVLTVDEEAGFGGVHSLVGMLPEWPIDAAVIGEPTELSVVIAHKGTQRWWIEIEGRSAHSAKPHLGINAIHGAARLIRKIQEDYASELARRTHPLLGSPTVNVSIIEGGTQVNLVPQRARMLIDRRTLPGETRESVAAEIEALFNDIKLEMPHFKARQETALLVDPPLATTGDHPLVRSACAISARFDRVASPIGVPYGTDGSKLSAVGIPTIVVGPGSIDQAHTADEFLDLDELQAGARYHYELMMSHL